MELITEGTQLSQCICRLIRRHQRFSFAVAWANAETRVMQTVLANRDKLVKGVIGIHFYQTDSTVLEEFISDHKVHFVLQPQGTFHPKCYLFWTDKTWELLVGSANMTKGAFGNNQEVSLLISSEEDGRSDIAKELLAAMKNMWRQGITMDAEKAQKYKNMQSLQKRRIAHISGFYGDREKTSPLDSPILTMDWDSYYKKINNSKLHEIPNSCDILETAKQLFHEYSFAEMDDIIRKSLAGLRDRANGYKGLDWGWFGSMKGAGMFAGAINSNNRHLSAALDCIPLHGPVSRNDYNAYTREFLRAFPRGGARIACMTRLLAMKRPDHFVCIDGRNRRQLCRYFGITQKSAEDCDGYWEGVIMQILDSVWWNSPCPAAGLKKRVWQGRTALLDAIFYEE